MPPGNSRSLELGRQSSSNLSMTDMTEKESAEHELKHGGSRNECSKRSTDPKKWGYKKIPVLGLSVTIDLISMV